MLHSLWRQAAVATAAKQQRQWSNRRLLWQRHQTPAQAQACRPLQVTHHQASSTVACLPTHLAPCRCTMVPSQQSATNRHSTPCAVEGLRCGPIALRGTGEQQLTVHVGAVLPELTERALRYGLSMVRKAGGGLRPHVQPSNSYEKRLLPEVVHPDDAGIGFSEASCQFPSLPCHLLQGTSCFPMTCLSLCCAVMSLRTQACCGIVLASGSSSAQLARWHSAA